MCLFAPPLRKGKNCMRKILWIILARLFVPICAPNAHAQTVTYTITFSPPNNAPHAGYLLPTSGAFVYDYTSNQFLSFTVHWHGLLFDLTSAASSPQIISGGPPCMLGASGPLATLALMTLCPPVTAEDQP
jgi:hypothetical protein